METVKGKTFLRQMRSLVGLSFLELWRRNDIFALLVLALAVMAPLSMATPFGAHGASRYMDEAALLLIWGFSLFISLGAGARLFPPEFESRTVYPLFSKPISRGRLLFGKYLGAVAASWSALALFYALFAGSMLLRGASLSVELFEAAVLHFAFVALAVSISLLGSLAVTPSANLTLSAIVLASMFFFGRKLPDYAASAPAPASWLANIAYAVAPHAEFFDMRQRMIHGWGAVDGCVMLAVLGYAAVYSGACLALAALVLKRKRI
ncbi:MAG: ABC transporter permease [Kiritimatiellae bacterium]|nr:ABC transporter permease [Kiritimatiellia bacterium]